MPMSVPNNAPMAPVPQNNASMYQSRNYFSDFNPTMRNLPGYFIKDESEIIPKYIPMDGSISFFPYQNLSKIVIKQWDSNGLQTLTYVLAPIGASAQSTNDTQTPDGQGGDQLPLNPQVAPRPDPVMATLENINSGLANTFNQVGTTLQAIQQEVTQLNTMLSNAINEGLGGRG